jgi:hypothetical protein
MSWLPPLLARLLHMGCIQPQYRSAMFMLSLYTKCPGEKGKGKG